MRTEGRELTIATIALLVALVLIVWLDTHANEQLLRTVTDVQGETEILRRRVEALEHARRLSDMSPPESAAPGTPSRRRGTFTGKLP